VVVRGADLGGHGPDPLMALARGRGDGKGGDPQARGAHGNEGEFLKGFGRRDGSGLDLMDETVLIKGPFRDAPAPCPQLHGNGINGPWLVVLRPRAFLDGERSSGRAAPQHKGVVPW